VPKDWKPIFPILRSKTYLANHSLGAVPAASALAVQEYYDAWASLGIEAWEGPWWKAVTEFNAGIEELLNAPSGTVAPMTNATRAMAAVASTLDYSKRPGVVLTDLEFTTFYPFWRGQEQLGARLTIVKSEDGIRVDPQAILDAVDETTALVATCHVYFRSAAIQDIRRISEGAREHGAPTLADGYQVTGTIPIDVMHLGVDYYVGGSHKYLCGGPGASFLYASRQRLKEDRPAITGWFGLAEPFAYAKDLMGQDLHPTALRYLDGTPSVPALYAAREGQRIIRKLGVASIRRLSMERTRRITEWARDRGIRLHSPEEDAERGGMVCLDFDGAKQATQRLVASGIIVDYRPDCGLRVSPHFYNSESDVDAFLKAVAPLAAVH
jgi:kynureninase